MNRYQNPGALKRLKREVETGVEQLAGALEAVIVAPADHGRDFMSLQVAAEKFGLATAALKQLQLDHLALLAGELQLLLQDTLGARSALERSEVDLRLESAFVVATDLPALIEYALRRQGDGFELVFRLVNRLRKARGCAVIFAASVLQKNEDVNFGKLFADQPKRMQGLVTKQLGQLKTAAAALAQNPEDAQALQVIASTLENLELVSRDYQCGVLWGIARGLAESHASGHCDKSALAGFFRNPDVYAGNLLAGANARQASNDEPVLAQLVNMVAASNTTQGRVGIAKLWYQLDSGFTREHKADYRDMQVGYWSKSAIARCLLLVSEDCRNLLGVINNLADGPAGSREKLRELHQAIRKSGDVLRMLGLQHLVDLIESSLPAMAGEVIEEALRRTAVLLHRINDELDSKLARMEREVIGSVNTLGNWERINASQARLLQNAMQILEDAMHAITDEPAGLRGAREKLGVLANVLVTVQMAGSSRQLVAAGDYLDWLLEQPSVIPHEAQTRNLVTVLAGNLANLEQLLYGLGTALESAVDQGAALAESLTAFVHEQQTAALPVTGTHLMVVPVVPATNDEESAALVAPVEPVAPVVDAAVDVVAPVPETVEAVKAAVKEEVDEALLAVFLEEADELLQTLDALYLRWSVAPADKTCLDEYLRALHTIKGSAALVGEHAMSQLAHEYETLILDVRRGNNGFDAAFFQACDARLHALHEVCTLYRRDTAGHIVKAPVTEPQPAVAPVLIAVDDQPAVEIAPVSEPVTVAAARQNADTAPVLAETRAPEELIRVSGKLLESLLNDADEVSFARSRVETGINDVASLLLELDASLDRFRTCVSALDHQSRNNSLSNAGAARSNDEFDALELDRYTALQELAVSLAESANDLQDVRGNLGAKVKEIGHVLAAQQRLANALQDGLIVTQMVPFASVMPRLKRLVRQIGGTLGKPVNLLLENRQGSVDRSILQAIITPLEHIIRNAIDHGIESPELRRQLGKPEIATLRITVARRGASVRIEIRDDGQGVDIEKVRQRAVRNGLLAGATTITEHDAYRLLFQNGFTTATEVSSISGRGVGLDVVKSEIAQIGGAVEVESARGVGTVFILTLPLTSSLNRALVFMLQETRYVVLMNTLDGVIVDKLANIHQKQQQGQAQYEYGGRHYHYLYLGKLISDDIKPRIESIDASISLLLVAGATGNYALHIDAIVESRDLVVKTLGQQFAAMPGIAGGVILPDGSVAIVLDLKAMVGTLDQRKPVQHASLQLTPRSTADKHRKLVMVVDDSVTVRKATTAMLKRNGMDVVTARNGVEAVELLETTRPDLILLDIEMPQMDGFEVASFVRGHDLPIRDTPIIMITSRIGDKHRTRAEAIGVNEYLCKPFKEDSLLASIKEYSTCMPC